MDRNGLGQVAGPSLSAEQTEADLVEADRLSDASEFAAARRLLQSVIDGTTDDSSIRRRATIALALALLEDDAAPPREAQAIQLLEPVAESSGNAEAPWAQCDLALVYHGIMGSDPEMRSDETAKEWYRRCLDSGKDPGTAAGFNLAYVRIRGRY